MISEYNKKPQGFVKTFSVGTFGFGEVIGNGNADSIENGDILTINGKSCEFEVEGTIDWDEVYSQLLNSEIGMCGLFTISRNGVAGEVDIKVNDDYTDCIIERDDTGLFTDDHEIYNGKKRGAKITIPNHWNTNNVPKFTIMNSSNNVDWKLCSNIYSYHPITGVFSFLAMNNKTIEEESVKNILFKVYAEQLGEILDE